MTEPAQPRPTHSGKLCSGCCLGFSALIAGAAFAVATTSAIAAKERAGAAVNGASIAAALAIAWYVTESVYWLIAALRPPNDEVPLVYLVPRLVCTPLSLAAAYQLGLPRPQTVLISLIATICSNHWPGLGLQRPCSAQARPARANAIHRAPGVERKTRCARRTCDLDCRRGPPFLSSRSSLTLWAMWRARRSWTPAPGLTTSTNLASIRRCYAPPAMPPRTPRASSAATRGRSSNF